MSWTGTRIDQLKSLWEKGRTARQIADALGGVSRNAVIGKAHRLGLQPRPSPVHNKEDSSNEPLAQPPTEAAAPVPAEPPPPVAKQPAKVARDAAPIVTGPIKGPTGPSGPPAPPRRSMPAKPSADIRDKTGLLDLTDKICRWPIGHPGEPDFHFCGEPVNSGFPYCLSHCAAAYQVPKPRRDGGKSPPSFGGAWKR